MTIQSANDAQERDPKTVILSGFQRRYSSRVGRSFMGNHPDYQRAGLHGSFQTQEFFFANNKIVQTLPMEGHTNSNLQRCCMQVAEVELLAVQEGADCSKAKFLSQPINNRFWQTQKRHLIPL